MAYQNSPRIITNGLAFCYDAYNTKSFVGAPVTNYQWNGGAQYDPWTAGGTNTDVSNTSDAGPVTNAKTWKFVKTGTSNQWNGWEGTYANTWTGLSGDIWTTSYWYKTFASAGVTNFGVGGFFTSDWSRAYNYTILSSIDTIIADGDWHYNYTVTRLNEAYTNAIIVDGPSWGYSYNAGVLYINGLQWAKKSYASPFAAGTRSSTQSILDMAKNYTVEASNTNFDYAGNILFTGTNGIKINSNSTLFSNNFTWTAWHYLTSDSGGYTGIFWAEGATGGGSGYQYLLSYRSLGSNAYAHYRINNAVTGWTNTDTGTLMSNMLNTWVHTTWTFNNGTTKIYINGQLKHTDTTRGSYTGGTDSPVFLGTRNDYSTTFGMRGYLPTAHYYNRVLNDTEVLQNYNATKSRFGL